MLDMHAEGGTEIVIRQINLIQGVYLNPGGGGHFLFGGLYYAPQDWPPILTYQR